jgi:hypothetical protein
MTNTPGSARIGRKLATAGAVAATGFLCGWSALGLTGGTVLAIALCAGMAVPLFPQPGKTLSATPPEIPVEPSQDPECQQVCRS